MPRSSAGVPGGAASASAASCRAGLRHPRLRRRPRPCCRPTPPGNLLRGPPGTASIGHGQFPLSADNATATPVVSLVRPCLSGPLRLAAVLVLVGGSCTSCAASRCWAVRADLRRACGPQCRRAQLLAASASVRDRLPRHRVGLARLLSGVHRRFKAVALASVRLAFYVARRSSTAQG